MNKIELQENIAKELSTIGYDNLKVIAQFVQFIKQQEETKLSEPINYIPASGGSILRDAVKWKGDDLEDCLKLMYETRSKVTVNRRINPFE